MALNRCTIVDQCTAYFDSLNFPVGIGLYFPPNSSAPLTCQEQDTNGESFYQTANYTVAVSLPNQTQTIYHDMQCNNMATRNGSYVICEEPLYTLEKSNECGFICPLPSYNDGQLDSIKVLQLVLGWFSWLRQFPSNLILMTAVAAHAESVGMILPTFFGYDNTWCSFDTTYLMPNSYVENRMLTVDFDIEALTVNSGLCTFQGWLVQMAFLSSTMWWGIVACNMFLSVFFGKKLPTTKAWNIGLQVTFHVCGWVVPVVLMTIPAAAGQIGFAPGASFCSLDSADIYFLVFWAIPIGSVLLVGTLLFLASLIRLLQYARKVKELKKTCGTYFRVILFILIYLCLISFIFSYSLRVVSAKDAIEEGYSDYYLCLLSRQPDCSLSEEVHNFGLAVLRSIGYSSLGLLLFFNFCISPSMATFWWRFFKHVGQGRFSSMFTSEKTGHTKSPVSKKNKSTATRDMITMSVDDGSDAIEEVIP
ncbi:hypothetical protein QOT17_000574 [Balamuthia mandrillaris]